MRRVDSDNVLDVMEDFQLHGCHGRLEVNLVEPSHQQDLGVSFPSIAGPCPFGSLANFDDDQVGHDMAFVLVKARVDARQIVLSSSFSKSNVRQGLWIECTAKVSAQKQL
jgi:hypothetical protein